MRWSDNVRLILVFLNARQGLSESIDLCCPDGEALILTAEGFETCGSTPLNDDLRNEQQLQGEGVQSIELRSPAKNKQAFLCPNGLALDWPHHFPEYSLESNRYKVDPDGNLIGTKVTDPFLYKPRDIKWKNGEFCVAYADPKPTNSSDYDDYESDGVFELVFGVCLRLENESNDKFERTFHPYALGISVFFLILTIAIYVWFKGFTLKDLNSRIYVAFLLNLTVAYTARYECSQNVFLMTILSV